MQSWKVASMLASVMAAATMLLSASSNLACSFFFSASYKRLGITCKCICTVVLERSEVFFEEGIKSMQSISFRGELNPPTIFFQNQPENCVFLHNLQVTFAVCTPSYANFGGDSLPPELSWGERPPSPLHAYERGYFFSSVYCMFLLIILICHVLS